jgi:purine-cytosine permease-like protein
MGWWPSKIIVLLNLVQMIGYGLIDCVVGGQILSAVSPNGMSVAVGKQDQNLTVLLRY